MAIAPELERRRIEGAVLEAWRAGWRSDPDLLVWEWADRYFVLTSETSAEHGQYRHGRTPYVRRPLEDLSGRSSVRRVVLMWGGQTAKTTVGLCWMGSIIDHTPGPMMMVQPTVDVGKNVSKERIAPLIANSPRLSERVLENRSRDGENTILNKRFYGGFLKIAGANSAASLRSTPIKYLFLDEVDAYPLDVDGEGDPIDLAEIRSTTFTRGKTLVTSTPTYKNTSRIEREFLESNQCYYCCPCPHCGHMDRIRWSNIVFDPANATPRADEVTLLCGKCGVLIEERFKTWMMDPANGAEWRATAAGDGVTTGYHLSGLYSPLGWLSWAKIVREWLRAQKDPQKLKVFVNTRLAETWQDRAENIEPEGLLARCKEYEAPIPDGVGALVASVDAQADRLECLVVGFGIGEECWPIQHFELVGNPKEGISGDPGHESVWSQLDAIRHMTWKRSNGEAMRIECMTIDSGYATDQVYRYCKARAGRRVYAVKGGKMVGQPLVGRHTVDKVYRSRLYTLCVDTGKDTIMSRLRVPAAGPGYMHFPMWVDREFVDQLLSSRRIWKHPKGRPPARVWEQIRERDEILDCYVYAFAAVRILLGAQYAQALRIRVARYQARRQAAGTALPPTPEAPPETPTPSAQRPKRSWMGRPRRGWVQGWRK